MKRSPKIYLFLVLIVCILLILGYYRDFVFKSINWFLQAKDYDAAYTTPPSLQFMQQYKYDGLVRLKWAFTFLFTGVYLAIAIFTIQIIFKKKKYLLITIGVYAVIVLLSGLLMLVGFAFNGLSGRMYEAARNLMGLAQSPIILMILIPAFKLSREEHTNITN